MELTRRHFLGITITGATALLLAACGGGTSASPTASASTAASPASAAASVSTAASASAAASTSTSASASASAPASASASSAAASSSGALADSLSFVTGNLQPSLDPHWSLSNSGYETVRLFHEALVRMDDNYVVQPMLATSWKQLDPTTLQFKLRNDVKFTNGDPFTANDVKANLDRVMTSKDPNLSLTKSYFTSFKGADVVDDHTVNIVTKTPYARTLKVMGMLFLNSPKQFGANDKSILSSPIGTGPFVPTQFTQGQGLTATAKGNWRVQPKLKEVKFVQIVEPSSQLAALRSGSVDVVVEPSFDQIAGLKSQGFQIADRLVGDVNIFWTDPLPDSPLKDVRVRQAINYAVDQQAILKDIFAGFGRVSDSQVVGPEAFGYNPALKPYPYDPAKAQSLIKETGLKTPITVKMGLVALIKPLAEAVSGYLEKVGIQAQLDVLEFAPYIVKSLQGPRDPMWSFRPDYWQTNDTANALAVFASYLRGAPSAYWLDDPKFNDLYKQQDQELDETKRKGMLQQLNQMVYDQAPVLFLTQLDFAYVATSKVQGMKVQYDSTIPFDQMSKLK